MFSSELAISRVLYRVSGRDHSSRPTIARRLERPTWGPRLRGWAGSHAPDSVLLRMGFSMRSLLPKARCALTAPFHPYRRSASTSEPRDGGMFSVALSCESPRPAVSRHPALRSPDFPLAAVSCEQATAASDLFTNSDENCANIREGQGVFNAESGRASVSPSSSPGATVNVR